MSVETITNYLNSIAEDVDKVYEAGVIKGAGRYGLDVKETADEAVVTDADVLNALNKAVAENKVDSMADIRMAKIPYTATHIGADAFNQADSAVNLTTVLPLHRLNNVVSIGDRAFKNCSALDELDLRNVLRIGVGSFKGCTSLDCFILNPDVVLEDPTVFSDLPETAFTKTYVDETLHNRGITALWVDSNRFDAMYNRIVLNELKIDKALYSSEELTIPGAKYYSTPLYRGSGGVDFKQIVLNNTSAVPGILTNFNIVDSNAYNSGALYLHGTGSVRYISQLFDKTATEESHNNSSYLGKGLYELHMDGHIPMGFARYFKVPYVYLGYDAECNIVNNAFRNGTHTQKVYFGPYVKQIGHSSFGTCKYLRTLVVDNDNPLYMSKNNVVFSKDETVLKLFPSGYNANGSTYTVPDTVTEISEYACTGTVYLKSVRINENCKKVYGTSFADGGAHTEFKVAKNHDTFEAKNVNGNTPNGVDVNAGPTLYNKLTDTVVCCLKINDTSFNIPDGTKSIDDCAFKGHFYKNKTIVIPNTVKNISQKAFYGVERCTLKFVNRSVNDPIFKTAPWGADANTTITTTIA